MSRCNLQFVLQVKPGETCLDSCAAPGSKTMQLMEAATAGGIVPGTQSQDTSVYETTRVVC